MSALAPSRTTVSHLPLPEQLATPGDLVVAWMSTRRRYVAGRVVRVNANGFVTSFRPFGEAHTVPIRRETERVVACASEFDVDRAERECSTFTFESLSQARSALSRFRTRGGAA